MEGTTPLSREFTTSELDCGPMTAEYRLGSLGGKREKSDHSTQDMLPILQEEKCGLKYVMQSPRNE